MFFFLFLLSGAVAALADEGEEEVSGNTVDSYARYMPSRPVKEGPGKIELFHSGSEYTHEFKICGKMPLTVSIDSQFIGINKTVNLELPAHLTVLATDLEATVPFFNFEHTYFRIGATPSFYGDDWECDPSRFRIPSRYYAIYLPNDKWVWVCGIAVFPHYENVILPIFGLIYKPNERLAFNIVADNPNISYSLNDKTTLFMEGNLVFEEFEVLRDASDQVILRYTEGLVGMGVKYKVNKFTETSLSVGAILDNTLKYRDSQGKAAVEDGLYTQLKVEARF